MKTSSSKDLGQRGEEIAAKYLLSQNYQILERNYRGGKGEIDIIATKENVLIFVEVKTARSDSFGDPETWVHDQKQKQLGKVAQLYLQEKDIHDMDCRFDVIAIKFTGRNYEIKHIKNAFWLRV